MGEATSDKEAKRVGQCDYSQVGISENRWRRW